ncbi:MAG: hypothetical protein ACI9OD_001749, partial [Limisphaerales bacterium]
MDLKLIRLHTAITIQPPFYDHLQINPTPADSLRADRHVVYYFSTTPSNRDAAERKLCTSGSIYQLP